MAAAERIAVEVTGRSHFSVNTNRSGGGLNARRRLLSVRGWHIVSVPPFVWRACAPDERVRMLQQVSQLPDELAILSADLTTICAGLPVGLLTA